MLNSQRFELVSVLVWASVAVACGMFFYCCATARAPISAEPPGPPESLSTGPQTATTSERLR